MKNYKTHARQDYYMLTGLHTDRTGVWTIIENATRYEAGLRLCTERRDDTRWASLYTDAYQTEDGEYYSRDVEKGHNFNMPAAGVAVILS